MPAEQATDARAKRAAGARAAAAGASCPSVTREVARRAIDAKTKPLGALGRIEDAAVRLAVLQRTLAPGVEKARVCVFAADHGIAEEGVSAYPRSVTAEMLRNFDRGGAAINAIARANRVEVEVVDVGVDAAPTALDALAHVRDAKVRRGCRNFLREAAMSESELATALAAGEAAARRAHVAGVAALGLGEMGIGNSTAAAALLSVLTGRRAEATTGRGTGVDDAGLARKRAVVDRALELHLAPSQGSAREALRRVGGLELAAIAGAAARAAALRVAVIADGFISTVAILCAAMMAAQEDAELLSALSTAVFFSHRSAEHGHARALEACGAVFGEEVRPLLDLEMRLGEGTGAALAIPILRSAAAVLGEMATFESAGISAGEHAAEHTAEHTGERITEHVAEHTTHHPAAPPAS